ncbi:MAG TPA: bifunctional homocysteine S-methyltransferase/methylenetetrahydrofolate reductase [Gaiellaceae bacterium]|nr:bifunctional homocysteine S-methyltransferase/methylenetetrahydrofolate reductase [Gaiellaceae bacterium]
MANPFIERLETGPPLCCDGGLGSLITSAVPRLRCPEEANLRAPESVLSLHLGFIRAGAELIETNTFGANRRKLAGRYLEDEVERINSEAVKIARDAREVSGQQVFIAGAIGPIGDIGDAEDDRGALFAEQAQLLEARGVDLFFVETFYDLDELETAVTAVRGSSSLPVVALLTFDEDGSTLAGVSAREAAARVTALGVDAVGANHGAGPQACLTALEQMAEQGKPLAALPNLGLAGLAGGRIIFPHATPDYFSEFAAQAVDLGASLVGGCCGTTPTEIAAIRSALDEKRRPRARFEAAERDLAVAAAADEHETRLARDLREGRWVVSIQLDPPLGGSHAGMLEVAAEIEASGLAGFVDINDNATARAAMSGLIMAAAIERSAGIETIPHLTPRDSTIMGLESLLLGAHAEGIRNVLAVTGDPPEVGDYPGSEGVYELDSIGLTRLISRLNSGEDYNGKAIDAPTSFFPGVAVNPTADDLDLEAERYRAKIAAGARFAMTQILFDFDHLDRFLAAFGGPSPIPVLVGLFPLWSYPLAVRLHNEVPGILVPESLQQALLEAGPGAADVGLDYARRLYAEAKGKAAGVYVVAPFRRPLAALDVLH